jgi:hypothetical protein
MDTDDGDRAENTAPPTLEVNEHSDKEDDDFSMGDLSDMDAFSDDMVDVDENAYDR